jgi:hypothetical protein
MHGENVYIIMCQRIVIAYFLNLSLYISYVYRNFLWLAMWEFIDFIDWQAIFILTSSLIIDLVIDLLQLIC